MADSLNIPKIASPSPSDPSTPPAKRLCTDPAWIADPSKSPLPDNPFAVLTMMYPPSAADAEIGVDNLSSFAVLVEEVCKMPVQVPVLVDSASLPAVQISLQQLLPSSSAQASSPSTFDTSVSAAYDDEGVRRCLPYDVRIVCADDGAVVPAHKFVLVFKSDFFKCRFRSGGGASFGHGDSTDDMECVDVSGCEYAVSSLMAKLIKMMYKGCSSVGEIPLTEVLPLIYVADFLGMPAVVRFCEGVLGVVLKRAAPDFVMVVYGVAEQVACEKLKKSAVERLKLLQTEPEDFCKVRSFLKRSFNIWKLSIFFLDFFGHHD